MGKHRVLDEGLEKRMKGGNKRMNSWQGTGKIDHGQRYPTLSAKKAERMGHGAFWDG
jgi:hypothetical protein